MINNSESGVTLIILIVTIVIMIILAGTTAFFALNADNGIFEIKNRTEEEFYNKVERTEERTNNIKNKWQNVINHNGIDDEIMVRNGIY